MSKKARKEVTGGLYPARYTVRTGAAWLKNQTVGSTPMLHAH